MTYYIATTLELPRDEAVRAVEDALKLEGFGVINRIDMTQTLKDKIGVDFRPYTILGACNPQLAYDALQTEDKVGTMLPCNVVVQEHEPGRSEIAAIDPVASMQAIDNPDLMNAAAKVRSRMVRVIDHLATGDFAA